MYHTLSHWSRHRSIVDNHEEEKKKKSSNKSANDVMVSTGTFAASPSFPPPPDPKNPVTKEHIINIVGGMAQATLVTVTGYPLDLIKARLQAKMYPDTMSCLINTVKKEGFFGLYRGSAMPWLSHMVKRPIQYPISEYFKKQTADSEHSTFYNYLIGGATGVVGPIFGTPLQVVKIAMQTSETQKSKNTTPHHVNHYSDKSKNSWYYIKHNYRSNGIAGFYRGFLPTAAKDMVFGMSFIGTYYTLRDTIGTDKWYKNFANGAMAHCLTWCVFIPIDYVKTTVQRSEQKLKALDVIKSSYQKHGITVFWRGVVPACLRTIPVSGCAMMGYEYIRVYLDKVI